MAEGIGGMTFLGIKKHGSISEI